MHHIFKTISDLFLMAGVLVVKNHLITRRYKLIPIQNFEKEVANHQEPSYVLRISWTRSLRAVKSRQNE